MTARRSQLRSFVGSLYKPGERATTSSATRHALASHRSLRRPPAGCGRWARKEEGRSEERRRQRTSERRPSVGSRRRTPDERPPPVVRGGCERRGEQDYRLSIIIIMLC